MTGIDHFAASLLEEAKRFLEKAVEAKSDDECDAFLHAALMIGFCSFEAQLNAIADEMSVGHGLSVHDQAILQEKDVRLENGKFVLKKGLKIYRLEDRLMFLYARFSVAKLDKTETWWVALQSAVNLRNELTHPKSVPDISVDVVRNALTAIVEATDRLYRAVYKKPFPAALRGLNSTMNF